MEAKEEWHASDLLSCWWQENGHAMRRMKSQWMYMLMVIEKETTIANTSLWLFIWIMGGKTYEI